MKNLLADISKIEEKDDSCYFVYYEKLKLKLETYGDNGLSYSDIAQYVFVAEHDDIDYLLKHLDYIKRISKEKDDLKVKNGINKIKNHIQLEVCRLTYLDKKQKEDLAKLAFRELSRIQSMSDKLKEYDEKFQKNNKEINDWYANIVTILGLFAAIVVTFFGGLGSINSIFTNIGNVGTYRLFSVILMVIFAMFNIIFMLLYYIALITNKPIYKECSNICENFSINESARSGLTRVGNNCTNKNIRCSKKRYPFVFYFDSVIFLMMAILLIARVFKV